MDPSDGAPGRVHRGLRDRQRTAAARGIIGLQLRDIRRGPNDDRYAWTPFASSDQFTPDWWDRVPYLDDNPHYVGVWLDGKCRAGRKLDHDFRGSAHIDAPKLDDHALETQFIEVAESYRGQGIGTETVCLLAAHHPDRRFVPLSEDADDFWASLGWNRSDQRDGPARYRPMFVAPH